MQVLRLKSNGCKLAADAGNMLAVLLSVIYGEFEIDRGSYVHYSVMQDERCLKQLLH
jgi:hypothetical protein